VAPGVSKLSALKFLCGQLDVAPDEVIAFGDSEVDIPMLQWSGLGVAVAVANADRAVLDRADVVTDSCDEDGVAGYLDMLLR